MKKEIETTLELTKQELLEALELDNKEVTSIEYSNGTLRIRMKGEDKDSSFSFGGF